MFLLILSVLAVVGIFVFVFFNTILDSLLNYVYVRYKTVRRNQRPSRIFLVRHGESQANVDTSIEDQCILFDQFDSVILIYIFRSVRTNCRSSNRTN